MRQSTLLGIVLRRVIRGCFAVGFTEKKQMVLRRVLGGGGVSSSWRGGGCPEGV